MKFLVITTFLLAVGYVSSSLMCDICLPNGINCISRSEYKMCEGGKPVENGDVIKCEGDKICTDSEEYCIDQFPDFEGSGDSETISPKCDREPSTPQPDGQVGDCEYCSSKLPYTCVGPMMYAECSGNGLGNYKENYVTKCSKDYVCDNRFDDEFDTIKKYFPDYPCIPGCAVSIVLLISFGIITTSLNKFVS